MYRPAAGVPMNALVNITAAPAGRLLEHWYREFGPLVTLDSGQQVSFPLGQLRLLPASGPVEEPKEPGCLLEVLERGREAGHCPGLLLLSLHEPEDRVSP